MSGAQQQDPGALAEVLSAPGADAAETPIELGGGERVSPPPAGVTPEQVAEASGAGLADRMRAHLARLQEETSREFEVPGWGRDLIVRARMLDEDGWRRMAGGASSGEFIAECTAAILVREPDGGYREIPGFGAELAGLLGLPTETPATRLVGAVMGDRVAYVATLVDEVLAWQRGRSSAIEAALGE